MPHWGKMSQPLPARAFLLDKPTLGNLGTRLELDADRVHIDTTAPVPRNMAPGMPPGRVDKLSRPRTAPRPRDASRVPQSARSGAPARSTAHPGAPAPDPTSPRARASACGHPGGRRQARTWAHTDAGRRARMRVQGPYFYFFWGTLARIAKSCPRSPMSPSPSAATSARDSVDHLTANSGSWSRRLGALQIMSANLIV